MDPNITEVEWPSKRIPRGGMFHPRKVVYSPETHQMLKVIMDEAKLTMHMRKKLDWCLRSGSSLSDIAQEREQQTKAIQNELTIRPKTSRRRSYHVIKESGDLERERYHPTRRAEDREVIKKRLQDIMEFGRETEVAKHKVIIKNKPTKKTKQLPSKIDVIYELLIQIQEREEWLKEMESLGEGAKHREVINAQIAERIRRIEAIEKTMNGNMFEDDAEIMTLNLEKNEPAQSNTIVKTPHIEDKVDCISEKNDDECVSEPESKISEENQQRRVVERKTSKRFDVSEKEFGEIFTNATGKRSDLADNVKKENMRGFCIEGSPCISERSENGNYKLSESGRVKKYSAKC